jgi:hypothetical protein
VLDAECVHGNTYDYSVTEYKTTHEKVQILCRQEGHGAFWQLPSSHLSGRGCPRCKETGYRDNKPGYLYILTDDDITKVGITNKNPKIRCATIAGNSNKNLRVLKSYLFEDGKIPLNVETKVLRELRSIYKNPPTRFDGYKECFYDVNQAALLNRIEQLISQQTAAQSATKEQHSSNPASQEA